VEVVWFDEVDKSGGRTRLCHWINQDLVKVSITEKKELEAVAAGLVRIKENQSSSGRKTAPA
jgi:hypothetical protein